MKLTIKGMPIKNLGILYLFIILSLAACSSAKETDTKDICVIKKHYKDNVFQIIINEIPINDHWYVYPEAVEVTAMLNDKNKCMK